MDDRPIKPSIYDDDSLCDFHRERSLAFDEHVERECNAVPCGRSSTQGVVETIPGGES